MNDSSFFRCSGVVSGSDATSKHLHNSLCYLDSGMLMPSAHTRAQVQLDGPQLGSHSLMRCRSACA